MSKMQRLTVPSELLHIPLVGNYFRSSSAQQLLKHGKGERLCMMRHEPTNAHDSNAVRIMMPQKDVLVLVGYAQRHMAAKLVAFMKKRSDYDPTDWLTGMVKHVSREDYEVIPFGLIGKDDVLKMIGLFERDKPKYIEGVNKLLEGK